MNVVLTGAHGIVGTAIATYSSYEYSLLDVACPSKTLDDETVHPHTNQETHRIDIVEGESLASVFEGHDAVVHLAGTPDVDAGYKNVERNNIRGTRTALEAAVKADIESFVFASSNHVVGGYEDEHAPKLYDPSYKLAVDHESPIRPDSHYGASKAACEAWGRLYAERHDIQFYALRIGSVRPPRWDHPYGDAERGVEEGRWERGSDEYDRAVARLKCTWQSRQDVAHMVDCCLEDTNCQFEIFYGISDNSNSWFDIDHAKQRIGYSPRDSADAAKWDEQYGNC